MYIEETGAGDGDLKVTVEGEEYTAEANYDLDGDGVDETASVLTDDGHVSYSDENGDGTADVLRTVHDDGTVVGQARFDGATGDWVAERPEQHPGHHRPPDGRPLVLGTPDGDRQVGPATEDTDDDGRPDTAVLTDDSGTTLVTDVDGDGAADQVVQIGRTGDVTITHHTGDGQWAVVEQGRLAPDGQYRPHPAAGATDDATWTFDEPPGPAAPCTEPGPAHPAPARSNSDTAWR